MSLFFINGLNSNYKITLDCENRWLAWIYTVNILKIKNPKINKVGGYKQ